MAGSGALIGPGPGRGSRRACGYCGAQVLSAKFKCLGKCLGKCRQVFGGLSDGRSKRLVSVCVLPWKVRGPLPRVGFKGIWASGLPPAGPTLRRARLRCRARGIPANHAAARQSPPATYGRDRSWVGLARRLQKVRQEGVYASAFTGTGTTSAARGGSGRLGRSSLASCISLD